MKENADKNATTTNGQVTQHNEKHENNSGLRAMEVSAR